VAAQLSISSLLFSNLVCPTKIDCAESIRTARFSRACPIAEPFNRGLGGSGSFVKSAFLTGLRSEVVGLLTDFRLMPPPSRSGLYSIRHIVKNRDKKSPERQRGGLQS